MKMETKKGLHKKQGPKSVKEASTRKHDDNQDIIGSFTEMSYPNQINNALSHQVKTNY